MCYGVPWPSLQHTRLETALKKGDSFELLGPGTAKCNSTSSPMPSDHGEPLYLDLDSFGLDEDLRWCELLQI